MTFAQMREQMEKLKADMAKQQQSMDPEAKKAMAERPASRWSSTST